VARVFVDDVDVGLELIREGLACHFTRYSADPALSAAEAAARKSGKGFWAAGAIRPACSRQNESVQGPFHGNTQSRVYHAPSCPNYNCRNCTAVFQSAGQAERAGFQAARDCIR
jgi:hypothetical protein